MNAPHASEQSIHQVIATYLTRALPAGAIHFPIDHAGKASWVVASKLKARGGVRGLPDHEVMVPGFPNIYFEVKTAKGRMSPEQVAMAVRIGEAGRYYWCVRSVEEVEACLRHVNVPLRATVGEIRQRIAAQNEGIRPIRKRAAGFKSVYTKPRAARPTPAQVRRAEANRWLP